MIIVSGAGGEMANEDMDEDLAHALALSMQEVRPLLITHLPFTCLKELSG